MYNFLGSIWAEKKRKGSNVDSEQKNSMIKLNPMKNKNHTFYQTFAVCDLLYVTCCMWNPWYAVDNQFNFNYLKGIFSLKKPALNYKLI